MYNIVFSTDSNYICYTYISVFSLIKNTKFKSDIIIHIIHADILDEIDLINFRNLAKSNNCEINFYKISSKLVSGFFISGHVNFSTYFRIFISDIIPVNIEKYYLYLDSDILVLGDVSELFNSKDTFTISAVAEDLLDAKLKLNFNESDKYFNAGVLLINMNNWIKDSIKDKLLTVINKWGENLQYWDQDALNLVFKNNWVELDPTWNHTTSNMNTANFDDRIINIVHFTGSIKPWDIRSHNTFTALYRNYLSQTPYNSKKLLNLNAYTLLVYFFKKAVLFFNSIKH